MIFTDADNTLWDTDKVYADAQLALLEHVETIVGRKAAANHRLAYVRQIDQELAQRHHAGLRYPPVLLASALALVLEGIRNEAAVKTTITKGSSASPKYLPADELEATFLSDLRRTAELHPGVKVGLERLRKSGKSVVVVTEGHRDKCTKLLEYHGLKGYVSRIIESTKTVELFRRLRALSKSPSSPDFMIGDQLDRDIAPAKAAGFITIYFPSRFVPKWTPEEAQVEPDHRVNGFDEAASIILDNSVTYRDGEALQSEIVS